MRPRRESVGAFLRAIGGERRRPWGVALKRKSQTLDALCSLLHLLVD